MTNAASSDQPQPSRVENDTPGGGSPLTRAQWGPVQILCEEIRFDFDRRLERPDVLVAFVRELVNTVQRQREMKAVVADRFGGPAPSDGSAEVLELALDMLNGHDTVTLIARSVAVHEACRRLNPDDAYPTDHLIDMLSSCASAIRFGLGANEWRSRHAADAAGHVWEQTYGLSMFDSHTPNWKRDWTRSKLLGAIIGMMRLPDDGASSASTTDASRAPGTNP